MVKKPFGFYVVYSVTQVQKMWFRIEFVSICIGKSLDMPCDRCYISVSGLLSKSLVSQYFLCHFINNYSPLRFINALLLVVDHYFFCVLESLKSALGHYIPRHFIMVYSLIGYFYIPFFFFGFVSPSVSINSLPPFAHIFFYQPCYLFNFFVAQGRGI